MRLDCSYKMVTQVDPPNLQGDDSSSFWLRASPYTFFSLQNTPRAGGFQGWEPDS